MTTYADLRRPLVDEVLRMAKELVEAAEMGPTAEGLAPDATVPWEDVVALRDAIASLKAHDRPTCDLCGVFRIDLIQFQIAGEFVNGCRPCFTRTR